MPRTYLKNNPPDKGVKLKEWDWRKREDPSPEPTIEFKPLRPKKTREEIKLKPPARKPLIPISRSNVFDSSPELSFRVVGRATDDKDDPFDQLLATNKPVIKPKKNIIDLSSMNDSENASSRDNTEEEPGGLFASFSTETPKKTKQRNPSNRRKVTKSSLEKQEYIRSPMLSDTMGVEIKFQGDQTDPFTSRLLRDIKSDSPSGLLIGHLTPHDRTGSKTSVVTSTPVLTVKSSSRLLDEDVEKHEIETSPVKDISMFFNSVFTDHRLSSSSSPEFIDPTPQKKITQNRGTKHTTTVGDSHQEVLICSNNSDSIHDPKLSGRDDPSLYHDDMISIFLECVCGDTEPTESRVIICTSCQHCFHTDCVRLSDSMVDELETEDLAWFCPNCRHETDDDLEYSVVPDTEDDRADIINYQSKIVHYEQGKFNQSTKFSEDLGRTFDSLCINDEEDKSYRPQESRLHNSSLSSKLVSLNDSEHVSVQTNMNGPVTPAPNYSSSRTVDMLIQTAGSYSKDSSINSPQFLVHSNSSGFEVTSPNSLGHSINSPQISVNAASASNMSTTSIGSVVTKPSSEDHSINSPELPLLLSFEDHSINSPELPLLPSSEDQSINSPVLPLLVSSLSKIPTTSVATTTCIYNVERLEQTVSFSSLPTKTADFSPVEYQLSSSNSPLGSSNTEELEHLNSPLNSSLLFMRPLPPRVNRKKMTRRGQTMTISIPDSPSLQVKPGKNWRRSLSVVKRTESLSRLSTIRGLSDLSETVNSVGDSQVGVGQTSFIIPSTPDIFRRSSLRAEPANHYAKDLPRRSRLSTIPAVNQQVQSTSDFSRMSSLRAVPATPSMPYMSRRSSLRAIPATLQFLNTSDVFSRSSQFLIPATPTSPYVSSLDISRRSSLCMIPATPLTSSTSRELVGTEQELLANCTKHEVAEDFLEIYNEEMLAGARKVGEGAFGEVFLIDTKENDGNPVLKVVPIGGASLINDEPQTTLEAMLSEVKISNVLSKLRSGTENMTGGYVEVRGCHVYKGFYPQRLLELWDKFDEEKESENERPDCLPVDQLYITLEFNNGGQDLEKYNFRNANQALSAWIQVAHTLAVAEDQLEFEHRDLHWGNILIKETKEKSVTFRLGGDKFQVQTEGVITTIIDFSLSRVKYKDKIIYNDLSQDPDLFTAKGKDQAGGDYQFDIYRKMKKHNDNNWSPFNPSSNIFWLHYLLDKMTPASSQDGVHYQAKKTTKPHKSGLAKLRILKSKILEDFDCSRAWVRREGSRVDY